MGRAPLGAAPANLATRFCLGAPAGPPQPAARIVIARARPRTTHPGGVCLILKFKLRTNIQKARAARATETPPAVLAPKSFDSPSYGASET